MYSRCHVEGFEERHTAPSSFPSLPVAEPTTVIWEPSTRARFMIWSPSPGPPKTRAASGTRSQLKSAGNAACEDDDEALAGGGELAGPWEVFMFVRITATAPAAITSAASNVARATRTRRRRRGNSSVNRRER